MTASTYTLRTTGISIAIAASAEYNAAASQHIAEVTSSTAERKVRKHVPLSALVTVLTALLVVSLFAPSPAVADTKIVDGAMEYVFELHSGSDELLDSFYEYENGSNSQKVIERGDGYITVRTRADLSFFLSEVAYPVGERYRGEGFGEALDASTSRKGIEIRRNPDGETTRREFVQKNPLSGEEREFLRRRARQVAGDARYQWEAVERIMEHIRAQVDYRLGVSSNPVDVLQSGLAYCTGYANAGALMLRVLGIPAKVVESYIPPGHMWGYGQEGSGGYHAHVEVYYEDAGWVSYDPQATVHFVDPFHIVNFPRERLRIKEVSQRDERKVIDRLREPQGWNNYFKRKTEEKQHTPILTGKIYDRRGQLVTDSFRNGEWVYRRTENAGGEGVRILANGQFSISPRPGEETVEFFYRDGRGGWLSRRLRFDGNERLVEEYRMDDPSSGYTLDLEGANELYVWMRDPQERWRINTVAAGPEGRVFLSANNGEWTVSTEKGALAVKRRLVSDELEKGATYSVSNLPRYIDPQTYYLRAVLPRSDLQNVRLVVYRDDGRRYPEIDVSESGKALVPVPDGSFNRLLMLSDRVLAIKKASLAEPGTPLEIDLGTDVSSFRVNSGSRGGTLYLAKQKGGQYEVLHKMAAQKETRYEVLIDTTLLEGSRQYAVIPAGKQPIPLEPGREEPITLE